MILKFHLTIVQTAKGIEYLGGAGDTCLIEIHGDIAGSAQVMVVEAIAVMKS